LVAFFRVTSLHFISHGGNFFVICLAACLEEIAAAAANKRDFLWLYQFLSYGTFIS